MSKRIINENGIDYEEETFPNGTVIKSPVAVIEAPSIATRRQFVLDKWEPVIAKAREMLRQYQDEDKSSAAIAKAKANLKNLISQKNAEYTEVE